MQLFWDPGHGTAGPRHSRCDLVRIYLDADIEDLSGGVAFTLQHTHEPANRRLRAQENTRVRMEGWRTNFEKICAQRHGSSSEQFMTQKEKAKLLDCSSSAAGASFHGCILMQR